MQNYADPAIVQRTNVYAETQFLKHAATEQILTKMGLMKPAPQNKAETVSFRRFVPFAKLTTPMVEGVTPAPQQIQMENVQVTLQQWGANTETSDRVRYLHEDPVVQKAAKGLGDQATETNESIAWGAIKAGTNVVYGNGAARGSVNTAISINKLHAMTRILRANRAKYVTEVLAASTGIDTRVVEAAFVAVGHSDLEHDFRALGNDFVPVAKYGTRSKISQYEIGSVQNIRIVLSPMFEPFYGAGSGTLNGMKSVAGTNVDVYPLVMFGEEAFGHVPLRGMDAVQVNVLTGAEKSDPHNQRDIVAATWWYTCLILNQSWIVRGEFGATSL